MIQAIMLIALGFLTASLIGVLLAPSIWSRAYRLSRKRLEKTLPLTLSEIEATQDQLKASYAVRLRRLETALAGAKQKAALQLVDNSRLQMQIAALKDQIGELDLNLAEKRNAATVLEQTITKRFPELDREMAAVKAQLQERSYDLQDLTNKLGRRDEELAAAQRAAASYQEELTRLRQALDKGGADRSGRRLRRASQWDLDDYRAEYDRLNLELSKLRQQLAQLQDRDTQQVGVIKSELQKLAELILASAQPKIDSRLADRLETGVKRGAGPELRRERRPTPWPQPVPTPPAAPGVSIDQDGATLFSDAGTETPDPKPPREDPRPMAAHPVLSSVLSRLPEEKLPDLLLNGDENPDQGGSARNALPAGRSSLLRGVVTEKPLIETSQNGLDPQPLDKTENREYRSGIAANENTPLQAIKPDVSSPNGEAEAGKPNKSAPNEGESQLLAVLTAMSEGDGSQPGSDKVPEAKPGHSLELESSGSGSVSEDPNASSQNRTLLDRLRSVAEEPL